MANPVSLIVVKKLYVSVIQNVAIAMTAVKDTIFNFSIFWTIIMGTMTSPDIVLKKALEVYHESLSVIYDIKFFAAVPWILKY